MSLLWGIPYVFIKVAVDERTPFQVAFARLALGFVVLAPVAWRLGAFAGLGAYPWALVAYSVVELAAAWPLIGFAEQRIKSSLTAVSLAAVPLVTARLQPRQRPSVSAVAGLGLGFGALSCSWAGICSPAEGSCRACCLWWFPPATPSGR